MTLESLAAYGMLPRAYHIFFSFTTPFLRRVCWGVTLPWDATTSHAGRHFPACNSSRRDTTLRRLKDADLRATQAALRTRRPSKSFVLRHLSTGWHPSVFF